MSKPKPDVLVEINKPNPKVENPKVGLEVSSSAPIEQLAAELGTEDWVLAGAKTHAKWGEGKVVCREEFEKACAEVKGLMIGTQFPHPLPPRK